MAIDRVRDHLRRWNREDDIREFSASSATVALAAEALGCEPERIAKSLSFIVDNEPILIVAAGDAKIDNKKFRARFGVKPRMIARDDVRSAIGHDVGGVCPFGVNPNVRIFLDRSLDRFRTVFPACGSSNSAIELTIDELAEYTDHPETVDVSVLVNGDSQSVDGG